MADELMTYLQRKAETGELSGMEIFQGGDDSVYKKIVEASGVKDYSTMSMARKGRKTRTKYRQATDDDLVTQYEDGGDYENDLTEEERAEVENTTGKNNEKRGANQREKEAKIKKKRRKKYDANKAKVDKAKASQAKLDTAVRKERLDQIRWLRALPTTFSDVGLELKDSKVERAQVLIFNIVEFSERQFDYKSDYSDQVSFINGLFGQLSKEFDDIISTVSGIDVASGEKGKEKVKRYALTQLDTLKNLYVDDSIRVGNEADHAAEHKEHCTWGVILQRAQGEKAKSYSDKGTNSSNGAISSVARFDKKKKDGKQKTTFFKQEENASSTDEVFLKHFRECIMQQGPFYHAFSELVNGNTEKKGKKYDPDSLYSEKRTVSEKKIMEKLDPKKFEQFLQMCRKDMIIYYQLAYEQDLANLRKRFDYFGDYSEGPDDDLLSLADKGKDKKDPQKLLDSVYTAAKLVFGKKFCEHGSQKTCWASFARKMGKELAGELGITHDTLGLKDKDSLTDRNYASDRTARTLGVQDLLVKSERANVSGKIDQGRSKRTVKAGKGILMQSSGGESLFDIISGIPKMRVKQFEISEECKRKLLNLQMLDNINGQVDRHLGNVHFTAEYENVDNRSRKLKLTNLVGIDNDLAFGTKFDFKNSEYMNTSTVLREVDQKDGKGVMFSLAGVDKKMFEKISSLSPEELANSVRGVLDGRYADALAARFTLIKAAMTGENEFSSSDYGFKCVQKYYPDYCVETGDVGKLRIVPREGGVKQLEGKDFGNTAEMQQIGGLEQTDFREKRSKKDEKVSGQNYLAKVVAELTRATKTAKELKELSAEIEKKISKKAK